MTAVFLSLTLNKLMAMKAISLKAAGKPSVSGIVRNIETWIASKSVTLEVIGAVVCYAGVIADSDPLMFAGAFTALCAIRKSSILSEMKGGDA